jgi:hypothetical protein
VVLDTSAIGRDAAVAQAIHAAEARLKANLHP